MAFLKNFCRVGRLGLRNSTLANYYNFFCIFALRLTKTQLSRIQTAMSSSESSSVVDEGSYSGSEYEIEDDCCKTTSQFEHERDPSYAIEEEFLDHVDSLVYTDEPLADDSWVEEYLARQEEYDREMTELTLRLNGQNLVNSW